MRIHIHHLHCLLNEESDKDEVFLKYDNRPIWPENSRFYSVNSGDRVEVNIVISHDPTKDLVVELWDWDLLSANDKLGEFKMHIHDSDFGKYTASLRVEKQKSTASYMLEWEIIED